MVAKAKKTVASPRAAVAPVKTKAGASRYSYGTGRRKTAIARVRLHPKGSGTLLINNKQVAADNLIFAPFELIGEAGQWDISVMVRGGGKQSQREAVRLGVARALLTVNGEWRQALKKANYLRRDPREKERMKPGLKRARRAPQWAKR